MPELTSRDGCPHPDLPRGECIVTRLEDGSLRIDHADPRVLISEELLVQITLGMSDAACVESRTAVGSVLKIRAVNRQVVYRITEYLPAVRAFVGEWPD